MRFEGQHAHAQLCRHLTTVKGFRRRIMKSIAVLFLCLAAVALTSSLPPPLQRNEVGGIACSACQIMVGTAENLLVGNHTETEVISTMEQVGRPDGSENVGITKSVLDYTEYSDISIDAKIRCNKQPFDIPML